MKFTPQDFADVLEMLRGPSARASASEQRKSARLSVHAKVNFATYDATSNSLRHRFSGLTRDISITGVGLFQTIPLQSDEQFVLTLPRRSKSPICVICHVMHCRPLADGLFAIGAEFDGLASDEIARQLLESDRQQHDRIRESILA
jgi:hypothetical protein